MQRPPDRPAIFDLACLSQCRGGDPAGGVDLAEIPVRSRGKHQQPGPVPGLEARLGHGPVQRGEGFGAAAGHPAALGQRHVQVDEQIGVADPLQRAAGHPLGLGDVAHPVERIGQPARQHADHRVAGRRVPHRAAQDLDRDRGRLADQRRGRVEEPAHHPARHWLPTVVCGHRGEQLPGHPIDRRAGLGQRSRGGHHSLIAWANGHADTARSWPWAPPRSFCSASSRQAQW